MKKVHYNLSEMEPVIRNVLSKGGTFQFYPQGTSMLPSIVAGKDQVLLAPLPENLKKYQVVLYKRENGAFVLHRIVKKRAQDYVMRGDNQYVLEPGIHREQMIGIVEKVIKPDQVIDTEAVSYRMKWAIWVHTAFFRRYIMALGRRVHRIVR